MPVYNHFLIGLGGTGGAILKAFRKRLWQTYRTLNPARVNLQFLYVDTDTRDMAHDDPSWKVMGQSVQLGRVNQLPIAGIDLAQVVNNVNAHPHLAAWLGDRDKFRDIINSTVASNVQGAQKRRFGRFLFASNAQAFAELVNLLTHQLQINGKPDAPAALPVTFHVCCGLAGGTGSGGIVDVVCQLRRLYPDPANFRILIYAGLPERNPNPQKGGENYHANAYAAIAELNALAVGAWRPHDVAYDREARRLDIRDPFQNCYLFHNENAAHVPVEYFSELPDIVANFLQQKTVETRNFIWPQNDDKIDRQESFMVGNQAVEPERTTKGVPARSCQFFSFGVKQITYPEAEIREFLAYSFARQSARQIAYNNWSVLQGFVAEAQNIDYREFVASPPSQTLAHTTDEHLILSVGILPNEKTHSRWKPIPTYWEDARATFEREIPVDVKNSPSSWNNELRLRYAQLFDERYRSHGVRRFYEIKKADIPAQARQIRQYVEQELFDRWKNGLIALHDAAEIADALIAHLRDRLTRAIPDSIAATADDAEQAQTIKARIRHTDTEWEKLGWATIKLGRHVPLFQAQATNYAELYELRTRHAGYQHAHDLLPAAIAQIAALSSQIRSAESMTADALTAFKNQLNTRCADAGRHNVNPPIVKFYSPEKVRTFAHKLEVDRSQQLNQTAHVRTTLIQALGERSSFAGLSDTIGLDRFIDILAEECELKAKEAHDVLAAKPDHPPVLSVNVFDELSREFGGDQEKLTSFVDQILTKSEEYLLSDRDQMAQGRPCFSSTSLILPDVRSPFRDRVCSAFRAMNRGELAEVGNPTRNQEITVLRITSGFPARYAAFLKFLRDRFEERLRSDSNGRARLELFSEGDGAHLPQLYVPTYKPEDLRPLLLLASKLDLIQSLPASAQTGVNALWLVPPRQPGGTRPVPVELGPTFDDVVKRAEPKVFESIDSEIRPLLDAERWKHIDARRGIMSALDSDLDALILAKGPVHPDVLRLQAAIESVRSILFTQEYAHAGA